MPVERANKKAAPGSRAGSVALREAPESRRGRPITGDAKKGNPDLTLTSVFLNKIAYADAKAILLKSNAVKGEKVTVSDILSDYLAQWVKKH